MDIYTDVSDWALLFCFGFITLTLVECYYMWRKTKLRYESKAYDIFLAQMNKHVQNSINSPDYNWRHAWRHRHSFALLYAYGWVSYY